MGSPNPAEHRGRSLAIARLDGRVAQGGEVHRRGPLLGARGEESGGTGGRERERHRPSGPDDPREGVCPLLLGRGCQQLLRGIHGSRGVRRQGHRQGALRVEGHGRLQEGRPAVRGDVHQDPDHVLQHVLHHEER